ncbi:MAG: hypothetical protein QOD06_3243, partial [Candidatus Binatota bacterium]|nr:hypothetical protein [Candidatus Binatota bacterium]
MTDRDAAGSLWPCVVLAFLHLAGSLHHFPPREIFSGEPLLTSDYGQRFLEANRVADYLRESGSFVGYSTRWMAGFPDGLAGLINNKPYALVLAVVPRERRPLAFNLAVVASLASFPLLVFAAARAFGLDRHEAAASMLLSMCAWYGSGLHRLFWRGGSVLFAVGAGVALWAVALLDRRSRGSGTAWPVAVGIAAVGWIHPGALPVAALGGAAVYLVPRLSGRLGVGELALIGATVATLNAPWLWQYAIHSHLFGSLYYAIYQGGPDHLAFDLVTGPFHLAQGPRDEAAVLGPMLAIAIAGMRAARFEAPRQRVLAGFALALGVLAYGGFLVRPLATLQPYRFAIPLGGVLAIAGGQVVRALRVERRLAFGVVAAIALVLLADRVRIARHRGDYLGAGLGRQESWALSTLRVLAAPGGKLAGGRALLEGDWLSERIGGARGPRRVSYSFIGFERYLDGELIGAPVMGIGVPQQHATFWRGVLFGRSLDTFDRSAFLAASELYDVGWVVTARQRTMRKLETLRPAVELVAASGAIGIFRVARRASRIACGEGTAT